MEKNFQVRFSDRRPPSGLGRFSRSTVSGVIFANNSCIIRDKRKAMFPPLQESSHVKNLRRIIVDPEYCICNGLHMNSGVWNVRIKTHGQSLGWGSGQNSGYFTGLRNFEIASCDVVCWGLFIICMLAGLTIRHFVTSLSPLPTVTQKIFPGYRQNKHCMVITGRHKNGGDLEHCHLSIGCTSIYWNAYILGNSNVCHTSYNSGGSNTKMTEAIWDW